MVEARFLLGANACSEPLRAQPSPAFMARLNSHAPSVAMAATTWEELVYGLHRLPPGRRRDTVEEYLLHTLRPALAVLPYGEQEAAWLGAERARLAAAGRPPPHADGTIAAVAVCAGLTLVTNNTADFATFQGISTVDWMAQ